MKNKAFKVLPIHLQNVAISLVNSRNYRLRHSGEYKKYLKYYKKWDNANPKDLKEEELKRLKSFLQYAKDNSGWYKDKISEKAIKSGDLSSIPILEKNEIINNLNEIKTLNEKDGLLFFTGGTTGASMKVVYTKNDVQERFAVLDSFRGKYGYKLGDKVAWFTAKNLISEKDIKKGNCSHYDFINKIKFYSVFHISEQNFDIYWKSLNEFQPDFIVGVPSCVYEICQIAKRKGLRLSHKVKVFFPTAETVLPQHRELIASVLGCKVVDQYASSEGAPFILECTEGNLHIHPLTGIFEVVDENMEPALEGEILVTSFTTHGTPLIRYRIGDSIRLHNDDKKCDCGSNFPLVDKIEGRASDFLYSKEKGKINSTLVTAFTRNVPGLICFQFIQDLESEIVVRLLVDHEKYNKLTEEVLIKSLKDFIGYQIKLKIEYISDFPREKSGKFRMVKNSLNLDEL